MSRAVVINQCWHCQRTFERNFMSDHTHKMSYNDACHAMQTGVAYDMQLPGHKDTDPKYLRVGINSAMCDHAALVGLLIAKGIITNEEYIEAITAEMNKEVERYKEKLSKHYGANIDLA